MDAMSGHWELTWKSVLTPESPLGAIEAEEAAWIEAARGGDRPAFEALVKRHERRVFQLAGRFFRRSEEIEDVAQETFLTIWRKLDSYRSLAPFEHWLTRLCLNCCYARLRKRRPEQPLEEAFEMSVAGDDAGVRIDAERLLAALAPEDRFVLQLLHGEGWSIAEISDNLGWSRAKVKVRAHRARKKLRRISIGKEKT